MAARAEPPMPPLLGGVLCLDFTNTVDPRHAAERHEHLPDYAALLAWSRHAGALGSAEARRLERAAARDPGAARRAHRRALRLREALYRVIAARTSGRAAADADLELVSGELARALGHVRLVEDGERFAWGWPGEARLESPLWPVALSAGELLRSPALARVHECPGEDGCGWLFLDTSRNQTRRWCSMRVCGNRAKARRHQARARRARA